MAYRLRLPRSKGRRFLAVRGAPLTGLGNDHSQEGPAVGVLPCQSVGHGAEHVRAELHDEVWRNRDVEPAGQRRDIQVRDSMIVGECLRIPMGNRS